MKRYWFAFLAVVVASFAVLGWVGVRIYQEAPPIPERVVASDGTEITNRAEIELGQNVWQAMGGMQVGSIWGHGSYVAPDWSADWLHREASFILDRWSTETYQKPSTALDEMQRGALVARLTRMMRTNTYDPATGTITVTSTRAQAYAANAAHFRDVFVSGRAEYAIPPRALTEPAKLDALMAFFFWTSWATTTERPGDKTTYTSNWPHEPLVGNTVTPDSIVWTGVSIILLLAGIGAMAWWHATQEHEPRTPTSPPPIRC